MLGKENTINKDKEFDRAFKTGQSFYTKILGLKAADNGLEKVRVGIIISTKVSKKAVIRNKLRRQIKAIIKQEMPKLKPGKDLVFIVFNQILDKDFSEITASIILVLKKLKLYNEGE